MPEIKKIHCNSCKRETNHELLATHDQNYYEEEDGYIIFYEKTRFGFWVCRGCDTASLEDRYTNPTMKDYNHDEIYDCSYFPERNNLNSHTAKKFLHIDKKLNAIYLEIIKAHKQGLTIISAIGVRALLEGICVTEGIDDNASYNLTGKLKKLREAKKVPESIFEGLDNLKIIGDDAAHRLDSSDIYTIKLSIELLEALLIHLYEAKFELERKAKCLEKIKTMP